MKTVVINDTEIVYTTRNITDRAKSFWKNNLNYLIYSLDCVSTNDSISDTYVIYNIYTNHIQKVHRSDELDIFYVCDYMFVKYKTTSI